MNNSNIVWSKITCPYCDMAKKLLIKKEIVFEEKIIGQGYTREQLLEAIPSARTVPQIILRGKLIGGYDQLKKYFDEGGR